MKNKRSMAIDGIPTVGKCGMNEEMNKVQLKQDLECTENYLTRNIAVKEDLLRISKIASYEVNTLLNSAIGRVCYEIEDNKLHIKSLKKSLKGK